MRTNYLSRALVTPIHEPMIGLALGLDLGGRRDGRGQHSSRCHIDSRSVFQGSVILIIQYLTRINGRDASFGGSPRVCPHQA